MILPGFARIRKSVGCCRIDQRIVLICSATLAAQRGIDWNKGVTEHSRHDARTAVILTNRVVGVRPEGRTGLDGGFDRLPGVDLLEPGRAQIAERRMESAGVVELIDKRGRSAVTSSKVS